MERGKRARQVLRILGREVAADQFGEGGIHGGSPAIFDI
jgi:hypothetical protein